MKGSATSLWNRATEALKAGEHVLSVSPDAAASRAYYAAFYAVSALFALRGRTFSKHSAVETAVHRDLVKPGVWPAELGETYSQLAEARSDADYGQAERISPQKAQQALQAARQILKAVGQADPKEFSPLGSADFPTT